ncbi:hypothetical protein P171DRAFT_448040 [Karstenula rhodostoma CBS 690.94]|uniref:BTB domain-containing protein n=1 Tax=Karstenula rhodostoma CBS 690.94 TaxID=1392251 RepID=A0A9P4U7F4_9PLEO|nr:hypothetical protein P171DRAFT_448040 [Karstenula rhodostoma CBS 690.94]
MGRKRNFDEFMRSMKSLLENGEHSDFKITCRGKTWNVHKPILCSQSAYFEAVVRFGGMETSTGVLDLPEEDPEILGYMIQFLYNSDYELPSDKDSGPWWVRPDWRKARKSDMLMWCTGLQLDEPEVKRHIDNLCWIFSPRFMTQLMEAHPRLKEVPRSKVSTVDGATFQPVLDLLTKLFSANKNDIYILDYPPAANSHNAWIHAHLYAIADRYDLPTLKETAAGRFEKSLKSMFSGIEFHEAVGVAFTTTPDTDTTLRQMVAKHIYEEKSIYGWYSQLDACMGEVPGLAHHVCKYEWSLMKGRKMGGKPALQDE